MDAHALGDVEVEYDTGAVRSRRAPARPPFVGWYDPLVPLLADVAVWRPRRRVDTPTTATRTVRHRRRRRRRSSAGSQQVGVERPHLVGHSYGGLLALELARRGHVDVRSLALLEPAGRRVPARRQEAAAGMAPLFAVAGEQRRGRRRCGRFLAMVGGDDAAAQLDVGRPVGRGHGLRPRRAVLRRRAARRRGWDVRRRRRPPRSTCPCSSSPAPASTAGFVDTIGLCRSWIAHARRVDVPGATHLLMAAHPAAVADALATFWAGDRER